MNKAFLTESGQWTQDASLAQQFVSDQAIQQARDGHRLRGCEVYYLMGEKPSAAYDFALPLMDFHEQK